MRVRAVIGWTLRTAAAVVGVLVFAFILAVLLVAFEGRSTFPAPLREDAAIARHMPAFRYRDAYEVGLAATPEEVYETLKTTDLQRIPALRLMLELRNAPRYIGALVGSGEFRRPERVTLDTLRAMRRYSVLEETAGRTLVLGTIARPWDGAAPRPPFTPESFGRFSAPGYVKSAVSFDVLPRSGGGTRLTVEWRMIPTDAEAMRRYGRYWLAVRPFAQLTAKTGLPRIAQEADSNASATRQRMPVAGDSVRSSANGGDPGGTQ